MTGSGSAHRYLSQPLGDFLAAVAAEAPTPGGGAVSAVTVGLAAGLVAMAAAFSSGHLDAAESLTTQSQELLARVAPLAEHDAAAYTEVLTAFALPKDHLQRAATIRRALARAADVPLEIAEIGVSVLKLAEQIEREGNPNLRGDAFTARMLAAAAVRSSVTLVEINLTDPTDPRRVRARALADAARRGGA